MSFLGFPDTLLVLTRAPLIFVYPSPFFFLELTLCQRHALIALLKFMFLWRTTNFLNVQHVHGYSWVSIESPLCIPLDLVMCVWPSVHFCNPEWPSIIPVMPGYSHLHLVIQKNPSVIWIVSFTYPEWILLVPSWFSLNALLVISSTSWLRVTHRCPGHPFPFIVNFILCSTSLSSVNFHGFHSTLFILSNFCWSCVSPSGPKYYTLLQWSGGALNHLKMLLAFLWWSRVQPGCTDYLGNVD